MFVAIMGEKKKCKMHCLFFFLSFFPLSLAPSHFPLSLFLSMHFLFCCTRAIGGYSHRRRKKERKRDISIQQKHNNDDATAVYCLPTNATYTTIVRGKKEREEKKEEMRVRARVYE
jgi:hypothetical protein